MKKELFANNNILLEVREHEDGYRDFWLQSGQAGIMLEDQDVLDLCELLGYFYEEYLESK
jgi:hypothetical protein